LKISGKWADHTIITVDPEMASQLMKDVIRFFNRIVKEKEAKKNS